MKEKVTLQTLKNSEKEARQKMILDAAERIFATKPYDKTSMREIADEAGISVSSIYRFFPDQEALIVEAAIRTTKNWIAIMEKIQIKNIDTPLKAFDQLINAYIDYISENNSYFQMMTILMSQGNIKKESYREIDNVLKNILDILDKVFISLGFKKNTRTLSRHFYISMTGIIVSYNKLQFDSRKKTVSLMKRHAKMSYELILNCPKDKLEKLILAN